MKTFIKVLAFVCVFLPTIVFASPSPYENKYTDDTQQYLVVENFVDNQYVALKNDVKKELNYTDEKGYKHEVYSGYIHLCTMANGKLKMDETTTYKVVMNMTHYDVDDDVIVTYYKDDKQISQHPAGFYEIEYQLYWAMAENAK